MRVHHHLLENKGIPCVENTFLKQLITEEALIFFMGITLIHFENKS